jgi:hypothetical protein
VGKLPVNHLPTLKGKTMYDNPAPMQSQPKQHVGLGCAAVGQIIGGAIPAPCRDKEIPEKVSHLFQQIEYLEQTALVLVQRLQPVLSPESANEVSHKTCKSNMTQLASQLSEARSKLQYINSALQSALNRLEL